MQIYDSVYGGFIVEPVLSELIDSSPVQRLKGIYQGGASYLVNKQWNVTRFQHSVGVMLLIRKLGGSIEEQIAGLLHDVSHTAFSHVIDFVLENKEENYHEEIFDHVIVKSEIPEVLHRYGFNYQDIVLDDSRWSILEQPAPDLCADRIDYTLRDMFHYRIISKQEADDFLDSLIVVQGKICVNSIRAAEWFVAAYYKEVIDFFLDPLNVYAYDKLAAALKTALDKKVLSLDELLKQDSDVLDLLRADGDEEILTLLNQLHDGVKVKESDFDYDIYRKKKVRTIDPVVCLDQRLQPASSLSQFVKQMTAAAYDKASKGTYVKVVKT